MLKPKSTNNGTDLAFLVNNHETKYMNHDTSYCFRLRRGKGLVTLKGKATELIEHDDHFELRLSRLV